jgi:AraC-like DNA-binding protein
MVALDQQQKQTGSRIIQHWAAALAPKLGKPPPDTVGANFIDRIVRGAVNLGASRPQLLSAIHLKDAPLRNPIGRVSRAVLVNLFAAIEREFRDPAAPMRLAAIARPGCFSDLGYIALFAPTVGDILGGVVDIQQMRQNVWATRFDRAGNPARIIWDLPVAAPGQLDPAIEFSVTSYVQFYRNALPTQLRPEAVHFRHQPRFDIALYGELLGCPVTFGATDTAIMFDRQQLGLLSPRANAALQAAITACYSQPTGWLRAGRRHASLAYLYLASELNKSPLKLDRLADSFGLSERTLRRKLVEEGYPFRELLDKVRRDLCDLYRMEGRRNMSEVAELLGYSELSAFTRAHKRWYGVAPSLFDGVPTT